MRSEYLYEVWESNRGVIETSKRVYEEISREGDTILFSINGSKEDTAVGNRNYRNGLFNMARLIKAGKDTIDINGKRMMIECYRSDLCGGSHILFVGMDGMVVREIRRQLWSKGIIHEERLTLLNHEV